MKVRVVEFTACAGCGKGVYVDPELDRVAHHKRGCPLAKSRLALRKAVRRRGEA